ncbi:MAG: hypothetical protein ACOYYF_00020 [Chloroflexota bacterium]|nr:hypothetical protein [Chloroflexota bacterium]
MLSKRLRPVNLIVLLSLCLTVLLASTACQGRPTAVTPASIPLAAASFTPAPSSSDGQVSSASEISTPAFPIALQSVPTVSSTPLPPMGDWRDFPILPETFSPRVFEIYAQGQALGRAPDHFSVIGDCQSIPFVFLGPFGRGEQRPDATENYLWDALTYFKGSFDRWSVTSRGGFTAASILSPMQADPQLCKVGETPLACEYRLNNPAFVFITLETWLDPNTIDRYEMYVRRILDEVIARGSVPILLTKADVSEVGQGVHVINPTIVRLAYEYQVPVVNFWRSAQYLENRGIDPTREGFHLSAEGYRVKNILALRALYQLWQAVQGQEAVSAQPTPSPQAALPSEQQSPEIIQFNRPDCQGGCVFFGTALSRDGKVTLNGVFAYAYARHEVIPILGEGFDLQDVSQDGHRLLVNTENNLYEINLQENTWRLISETFDSLGRQGAYWDSQDREIVYLDRTAPIETDKGQAFTLYPSSRDGEIYLEGGICDSKDACRGQGVYRLNPDHSLTALPYLQPVFSPDGRLVTFLNPQAAQSLNYYHIRYLLLQEVERGLPSQRAFYFREERGFMIYPDVRAYAFSPDSKRLMVLYDVYSEYYEQSQFSQFYLLDLEHGRIADFGRLRSPAASLNPRMVWSPDGQQVLFFLTEPDAEGRYLIRLYRSDLTSGENLILEQPQILLSEDYIYLTNLYWR